MTTKMFLLAVLGSNIFWIGVALFSLIGSALTMRSMAPTTYKWLSKGEEEAIEHGKITNNELFDKPVSTLLVLIHVFCWWVFVILWLFTLFGRHAWMLIGLIFRGVFSCIDKVIPNVTIKVEKRKY